MESWKKAIFVNAIKARLKTDSETVEEIIVSYTNLTNKEQEILRKEFSK